MTKRQLDAYLRNSRPTKQQRFNTTPKEKVKPKKGLKVRILHNDEDVDLARRALATLERWGYLCELIKE